MSNGQELLNQPNIADALVGFSTIFDAKLESLRKRDEKWFEMAMPFTSTGDVETHKWMGDVPPFEKWVGERKIGKVRGDTYSIRNEDWANGIEVHQNDIDDDKLGMYTPRVGRLAAKAHIHQINLMVDFLLNGFATTKYGSGYDGVSFFSTAHKDGDGPTYSNKLTASIDDAGALDSAFQRMLEMVDENGEPWGVGLTRPVLIVGPSTQAAARDILLRSNVTNGASNPNYSRAELWVSPKIAGAHAAKWFLWDAGDEAKPLVFQKRREVSFDSVEKSENYFKTRKLLYGASGRYNVGYGFPQSVVGSDGTT
jgi:phage major head subunit gpT-like protein